MSDSGFARRTSEDYAVAFAALLPVGAAWPRDPDSDLMGYVAGQAGIWGRVDARAADLLVSESDPRFTAQLLTEWERAYGLPDPCVPVVQTIPERRTALVAKITAQGGQSRAFFTALAATLGYAIEIEEFRPFQPGISSAGGSRGRVMVPNSRFYWRIKLNTPRLQRFSAGYSSAGRDSMLSIRRAEDLECVLNRWKPAHTVLIFSYNGV